MHTYIHTCVQTCILAYVHTYIHTYIRKRRSSPHTCIYIYNIYIHVYIYIHTQTHIYTFVYSYIHISIYIHTLSYYVHACIPRLSLSLSLPPSLYIYIYIQTPSYMNTSTSLSSLALSLSLTLSLSLQLVHCSCGFVSGSYICGLFYAKRDESCNIKFRGPGRQKLASIPHSSPNAKFLQNLSSTNLRTRISRIMTPKSGTPISTPLLYPYKLVIPITSRLDLLQKCLRHTGLAQES